MKRNIQKILIIAFGILSFVSLTRGVSGAELQEMTVKATDTIAGYSSSFKTTQGTPNEDITFRVQKPDGGIMELSSHTNDIGKASADFYGFHTRKAGTYLVSVFYRDFERESPEITSFEVYPDEVSPSDSEVTLSEGAIPADGRTESLLYVILKDRYENPIAGHSIKVVSSTATDEIREAFPGKSTNENGEIISIITSSETGVSYFTVLDNQTGKILDERAQLIVYEPDDEDIGGNQLQANIFGDDDDDDSVLTGPVSYFDLEFDDGSGNKNIAYVGSDQNYFTVTAKDSEGRTVTTFTGSIIISVPGDDNVTLPEGGEYTFRDTDKGSFEFPLAFKFSETGKQTIQVFDYDPVYGEIDQNIRGEIEITVKESQGIPNPCEPYPECLTETGDVLIKTPEEGSTYGSGTIPIMGTGNENTDLLIVLDDIEKDTIPVDSDGLFAGSIENVSDGQHKLYLQETAGDERISLTVRFSVDTTPPEIDSIELTPRGSVDAEESIQVLVISEPDLKKAVLRMNEEEYTLTEGDPGNYETAFTAPKEPGDYTLDIIIEDSIGNESTFLEKEQFSVKEEIPELPPYPRNVTATPGEESITLSWEEVIGHPLKINFYVLYSGSSEMTLEELKTVPGTETEWEITDLEAGEEYFFAITAVDEKQQESIQSETVSTKPLFVEIEDYDGPKNVKAEVDETTITVTWDPIIDHSEKILTYTIYMGVKEDKLTEYDTVINSKRSLEMSGLEYEKTFYFAVTATDNEGKESLKSEIVSATTAAEEVKILLPAPLELTADAGDAFVTVSWDLSQKQADSYVVKYGVAPGEYREEMIVSRLTNSVTIRDLINGVPYYFQVVPYKTGIPTGEKYSEVTATPRYQGYHPAPEPPLNLDIPENNDSGPEAAFIFIGLAFLIFAALYFYRDLYLSAGRRY